MSKLKLLKFSFHGKDLYANLLVDEAPITCKAVEEACPFESRMAHAKIVYNEAIIPTLIKGPSSRENPIPNKPGDIGLYDIPNTICCWHGDMKPLGAGNVFARFTKAQMDAFHEEAVKLWEEPGCRVVVDVIEEEG